VALSIKSHIASSVHGVIKKSFPEDFDSLCQVHAVVGANVAAIVLSREYRPVAGIAMVDCGGGDFIRMLDNDAFSNPIGGAYHCWIESVPQWPIEKEYVDFTFGTNHQYAAKNGLRWLGPMPPKFIWGTFSKLVVDAPLERVPNNFGKDRIWVEETAEGLSWMARHITDNANAYVTLTTQALKLLQRSLPSGSRALDGVIAPKSARSPCGTATYAVHSHGLLLGQ
jgi:hypothetical protein